ncbi:hypothetical protein GCM10027055_01930 [Janibacter alkaliphilus]|uniref:Type II secretory pathway pseudopilin PulG n=1 Tax=Janibacter alkaliphilus TaxID=1069963 RepID=A0A852X2V7_9MICO|nr:hypothetical protein [Janibacter alkaliphilus]NYG36807.1 type II secretory pathway pseudopilin PulG [Janibacter alkaliphilus]
MDKSSQKPPVAVIASAVLGVVLILISVLAFNMASEADARAEQRALENSTYGYADALDIELSGQPQPSLDDGSSERTVARTAAIGGGLALVASLLLFGAYRNTDRDVATAEPLAGESPKGSPRVDAAVVHDDVERYPCPTCGERIATTAKLCRFCQHPVPTDT